MCTHFHIVPSLNESTESLTTDEIELEGVN